jgi:DnaJ-class molecular chaperone
VSRNSLPDWVPPNSLVCRECAGSGLIEVTCDNCDGEGRIEVQTNWGSKNPLDLSPTYKRIVCPECDDCGKVETYCRECDGQGYLVRD